jgi:DNA-binding response OmpR family regulator
MHQALIVDDDGHYRTKLIGFLGRHAFRPIPAQSARRGITLAREHAPNLILLKWQERSDLAALRLLRREPATSKVPIIVMAAALMDSPKGEFRALDAGADFFFAKSELVPYDAAYAKPLLRHFRALVLQGRQYRGSRRIYYAADLRLDAPNADLTIDGKQVHLGPKELGLLEILLRRPNTIFPAKTLWRTVWAIHRPARWAHTLNVTVSSLRIKLGAKWGRRLVNSKTHGYRLVFDSSRT